MTGRSWLLTGWAALLGASVALAALAARHDTLPADTRIMAWAQDRAFPGEAFSDVVRAITTTEVVLATGAFAAIALWLFGRRWEAALLAAGLIALPLLQGGLKELVDRPRPAEPLVELRAGFSSESFPAGHVMSAVLLYGFLLDVSLRAAPPSWVRWPLAVWSAAALVFAGPPNVWLGVHWPSDVLGGYAWGLVLLLPLLYACQVVRRCRPF